jgi:hypothetical protein
MDLGFGRLECVGEAQRWRPFFLWCIEFLLAGMPKADARRARTMLTSKKKWVLDVSIVDRLPEEVAGQNTESRRALGCEVARPRKSASKKSMTCVSEISLLRDLTRDPAGLATVFIHEFDHTMQDFGIAADGWRYYKEIVQFSDKYLPEHEAHADEVTSYFQALCNAEAEKLGLGGDGAEFVRMKAREFVHGL